MAKHCDVCNRAYPDQLASCPRCARAAQAPHMPIGSESEIDLNVLNEGGAIPGDGPGSGSAVDLGERGRATHHARPVGSESEMDIAVPPARVPDTNSGVFLDKIEGESDSSVVEWAALVQDATHPVDASGVRVDSPSDKDLIAKAAQEVESASDVSVAAGSESLSAVETSGVRILPGSELDVEVSSDSASQIGMKRPLTPTPETSGVRILATSEADVVISDSASRLDIPPPSSRAAEESSAVNLGELHKMQLPPSDLNLASDALDSAASGIDLNKAAAGTGDSSVEAVVELAEDMGASSVSLGEGSGSEQSGLDLTMLSGGSGSSSSILPERKRRPQPPSGKSARKAPPTQVAVDEHFSHDDDSAVNLGALPDRPAGEKAAEDGAAAAPSAGPPDSKEPHGPGATAPPHIDKAEHSSPKSGWFAPPRARALTKVLAGTALGLVLGVGASAGLMFGAPDMLASLGVEIDKPKVKNSPSGPNPGQVAAVEQGGKDWAARFGDKGPDDVAKIIDQLEEGKKEAEQKAADQAKAVETAERKAAKSSEDAKTAEKKAAGLSDEVRKAAQKATDMTVAAEKAQQAEAAARKKADEAAVTAQALKKEAADLETTRRTARAEIDKVKDQLRNADAKQTAAAQQLEETTAARKQAEAVLEAAARRLKDGKYLKADAAATDVARAVEQVIAAAQSADPSGKLANVQAELAAAQSKLARSEEALAQRWTPLAMLDVWLALLQQPAEPEMAKLALADAERVARDAKANPAIQAKAACVRGLALRQQDRKDEAKTVLTEALKNAPAGSDWQSVARAALEEKPGPAVSPPKAEVDDGNPLLAEASYVAGVQHYWAGSYARAEERFLTAIRHDNRDARYHYYLGLSRWSQDKRAAAQRDFQRGAELERQERPARPAVNAALERIQGNLRQEVDQFRR